VAYLHDDVDAWTMASDGTYTHAKAATKITTKSTAKTATHGAQAALMLRYGANEKGKRGA
jgi:hypothetical protein